MSSRAPDDWGSEATCRLTRDDVGQILSAEGAVSEVLGWAPDELVGLGSIDLVHPDDQPSALAAWLVMRAEPGAVSTWRGRYRGADDRWHWVQTVNSNRLDDPSNPSVESVVQRVSPSYVGVEEELRAREQLLRRLAEALPVGVFQIDSERQVTFANDRLQELLGLSNTTVDGQFSVVVGEDRQALEAAITAVLADQPVSDLELRFTVEAPHPEFTGIRVCLVSLRPLTDTSGQVTGAIGCLSDVTDGVELRKELEIRASVDGLTGCLNRTATFDLLGLSLGKPGPGSGVAVIFVDLDGFKDVNDRFGHAAGDQALSIAAERICRCVRASDSVGRIGGDEFLVICPDMTGVETALPVAERLSETLRADFVLGDRTTQIGASVGLAWAPPGSESPDALVARADRAMYESKLGGLGSVVVSA